MSAELLKRLLDSILAGCRGALRVRVEGRSEHGKRIPDWLLAAASFDVVGIEEGSSLVVLEARPLAEAVPERFAQQHFFLDLDTSETAVGLLEQSLGEAALGHPEAELFDQPLLKRYLKLGNIVHEGFEAVEIGKAGKAPVRLTAREVERIDQLIRSTPPSQRARVAGRLDAIRHSDLTFVLNLRDGPQVKGVAGALAPTDLAQLFGADVVVSGTAHFRPSGTLLRLDADRIEAATGDVSIWERQPRPVFAATSEAGLRQRQGPRSGVSAIMGRWPGDESDQEVAAALAEMS